MMMVVQKLKEKRASKKEKKDQVMPLWLLLVLHRTPNHLVTLLMMFTQSLADFFWKWQAAPHDYYMPLGQFDSSFSCEEDQQKITPISDGGWPYHFYWPLCCFMYIGSMKIVSHHTNWSWYWVVEYIDCCWNYNYKNWWALPIYQQVITYTS